MAIVTQPSQGPMWATFHMLRLRNADGSKYLTRLRIIQTPWWGVYLHKIHGPDPGRDLHDHPWDFVSFVLRGWYDERSTNPPGFLTMAGERRVRWLNRKRAEVAHRITSVAHGKSTWTLVFVGPRRRKWGFWVFDGVAYRFVVAEDYFAGGGGAVKEKRQHQ